MNEETQETAVIKMLMDTYQQQTDPEQKAEDQQAADDLGMSLEQYILTAQRFSG